MSSLPAGDIKVYPNNGSSRWYYFNGSKREYLSKKDIVFAKKLVEKKFLSLRRNALLEQKENLKNREGEYYIEATKLQEFLEDVRYRKLFYPSENNYDENEIIQTWKVQKYNRNPKYLEQLVFKCPSGNTVRSKSEVFIDIVLSERGLPYRYEGELELGNIKFYPDFTILNPNTNEIIYWEHLGRMDDPAYARAALEKIRIYYKNGLIPGKNLYITFETKDRPFSYEDAVTALKMMGL